MSEIWKTIPYANEKYEINHTGLVRNKKTGKILKHKIGNRGYYYVHLSPSGGKVLYKTIHRLLAELFIDNPNGYDVVNHKDHNRLNNSLENLEWCTQKHNANHLSMVRKKLMQKYTYMDGKQIFEIKELYRNGNSIRAIERITKRSRTAIKRAISINT